MQLRIVVGIAGYAAPFGWNDVDIEGVEVLAIGGEDGFGLRDHLYVHRSAVASPAVAFSACVYFPLGGATGTFGFEDKTVVA